MSLYTRARKHIDMNRVKKLQEDKIARQIALQEKQYLLYFTQNTVPKYYDWKTGEFNENPLLEITDTIEKRLEEIDDALFEGMTMKDFKYLYGGVITNDIVSLNPNLFAEKILLISMFLSFVELSFIPIGLNLNDAFGVRRFL